MTTPLPASPSPTSAASHTLSPVNGSARARAPVAVVAPAEVEPELDVEAVPEAVVADVAEDPLEAVAEPEAEPEPDRPDDEPELPLEGVLLPELPASGSVYC